MEELEFWQGNEDHSKDEAPLSSGLGDTFE
jgi:hypothetical protein